MNGPHAAEIAVRRDRPEKQANPEARRKRIVAGHLLDEDNAAHVILRNPISRQSISRKSRHDGGSSWYNRPPLEPSQPQDDGLAVKVRLANPSGDPRRLPKGVGQASIPCQHREDRHDHGGTDDMERHDYQAVRHPCDWVFERVACSSTTAAGVRPPDGSHAFPVPGAVPGPQADRHPAGQNRCHDGRTPPRVRAPHAMPESKGRIKWQTGKRVQPGKNPPPADREILGGAASASHETTDHGVAS